MIELRSVPSDQIERVWPAMREHVLPALKHSYGTLSEDTVRAAIAAQQMQAYVVVDNDKIIGAIITEVLRSLTGFRYLHGVTLAGERFDEWRPLAHALMRDWGREVGGPYATFTGRRGWTKKLADLGWKEHSVIMALDLKEHSDAAQT